MTDFNNLAKTRETEVQSMTDLEIYRNIIETILLKDDFPPVTKAEMLSQTVPEKKYIIDVMDNLKLENRIDPDIASFIRNQIENLY